MPRLGERRVLVLGTIASVLGFAAFGAATQSWMMYAIIFPFAIRGIAGPAIQSLLTREVGASEQGELQGSLTSLMSLTAIAGPLLGTRLFAYFADPAAKTYVPGGARISRRALLEAVGLLLAIRLFARLTTTSAAPAPSTNS